nr:unnamed protein product [Callosobruchus chinensis]
MVITQREDLVN